MSKLFNLKEWLTIADAARHLSIVFNEEVTEADLLRLALDERLKLSIYIVNAVEAKRGHAIKLEEKQEITPRGTAIGKKEPRSLLLGIALDLYELGTMDDGIVWIDGVYDLVMLGDDRVEVENRYQSLIGGPEVIDVFPYGVYVANDDGQLFELQRRWEKCDELGNLIETGYCPANCLPFDDAYLVFRTRFLREFEESMSKPEVSRTKQLLTTERNSLLTIIAALCDYSAIKLQERGAAVQIAKMTDEIGATVSNDTVRRVLEQVPDALESRKK